MCRWMDEWIDGWMGGWRVGWMDAQMQKLEGLVASQVVNLHAFPRGKIFKCFSS